MAALSGGSIKAGHDGCKDAPQRFLTVMSDDICARSENPTKEIT